MTSPQSEGSEALSEEIASLAKSLQLEQGVVFFSAPDLEVWSERFEDLDPSERDGRATELVALALKLQRLGGKNADKAVRQLCDLVGVLLDSKKRAKALFAESGVEVARAAKASKMLGGPSTAKLRAATPAPDGMIKAGALARPVPRPGVPSGAAKQQPKGPPARVPAKSAPGRSTGKKA
ncbi:MAG: hypothetical protein HY791_09440 [Deltaproteobacteria bacterium]|nr:hypothetical protein [Deltaproteobacteria bacterium]